MISKIENLLHLPAKCLANRKITKTFFKRNFELTKNERNLLDDFSIVVSIDWIASISPNTCNVPAFSTSNSSFEEIQVIALQTNNKDFERNYYKLLELIQKYIPYHTLLILYTDKVLVWNTCFKRINENDNTKRVIDKMFSTDIILMNNPTESQIKFFGGLSFEKLDKTNLRTLYNGYVQQLVALNAAEVRGEFSTRPADRTKQDVIYLEEIAQLEKEITVLSKKVKRESQLNIQIDLNSQVQLKRKQIDRIKQLINT